MHAPVGGARLHDAAPALDHAFQRLQRAAGDDRGRDHHAAGELAVERQIGAPAEDGDLRQQAEEARGAADPEVAVERGDLHGERAGLLAAPMQDALVEHAHGVDDLRVARQRLGLRVGLRRVHAGLAKRRRRRALVDDGDDEQARTPAASVMKPRLGMDEEHRGEIERRHRRIEQDQHGRAGDEAAHLVQAAQRQHVAAVAGRRRGDDAGEHRAAEDGLHSGRQPPEHLAAQGVEQRQDGMNPSASSDSMTSVSMLRLVSTRSEIWNR